MQPDRLAVASTLAVALLCAAVAGSWASDRIHVATMNSNALKAASVAYRDFREKAPSESHVVPGVGAHLRDEANYIVEVWKVKTGYEINFVPKDSPELEEYRGGGYQYMINERFEIEASGRMK
jgi:hypothetical protein